MDGPSLAKSAQAEALAKLSLSEGTKEQGYAWKNQAFKRGRFGGPVLPFVIKIVLSRLGSVQPEHSWVS